MPKNEIIETLKEYVNVLFLNGIDIKFAYLYGSHAKNTQNINSDIDLMIITNQEYDDYMIGKIWNLTRKVNTRIEPYVINYDKFIQDNTSPLIAAIKEEGILINQEISLKKELAF